MGKRYDETLQKYSLNHDSVDFTRYQQEHPDEYPSSQTGAITTHWAKFIPSGAGWPWLAMSIVSAITAVVALVVLINSILHRLPPAPPG